MCCYLRTLLFSAALLSGCTGPTGGNAVSNPAGSMGGKVSGGATIHLAHNGAVIRVGNSVDGSAAMLLRSPLAATGSKGFFSLSAGIYSFLIFSAPLARDFGYNQRTSNHVILLGPCRAIIVGGISKSCRVAFQRNGGFSMLSGILSGNSPIRGRGLALISAFLCSILIAGCGAVPSSVSTTGTLPLNQSGPTISGKAFGGRQPITGATILLCEAGNTGYGSGTCNSTTNVAMTTTSGSFGTFTLPGYTCPTNTGLLYLKALGGVTVTGGANNPAAALMTAIGPCNGSTSSLFVYITEATTAADMAALAQFFNPANETIGSTSTNVAVGLTNAFATANNLVNFGTGQAVTSATVSGSGSLSSESITVTPDASKINTIANVLAACINSSNTSGSPSTQCSTLFSDVNATAATDTLQAAYYMATNPTDTVNGTTSNVIAVCDLGGATGPYQTPVPYPCTSNPVSPYDWTIGVTYGSSSENASSIYLFNVPQYLAVDGSGNIWVANNVANTTTVGNSVTEMSPTGVALNQVLTSSLEGPSGIVIDPSGNVWVSNYGKSTALQDTVVEYITSGAHNGSTYSFTTGNGPQYLASDGQGNIFVVEPSFKGPGNLEEIPAGTSNGSTATTIATGLNTNFSNLAIDGNYTIWISGGGNLTPPCTSGENQGASAGCAAVYQFLYNGGAYESTPSFTVTSSNTTNSGITEPEVAITVNEKNQVYGGNYSQSTAFGITGTSTVSATSGSPYTTTNLTKPEYLVVDGAGIVWATDAAGGAGGVFEYGDDALTLSPSCGIGCGFGTNVDFTGSGFLFDESYQLAVDPSGNVWVGNAGAGAPSAYISEIVGAAYPVVTPIAAGLPTTPGGTNRLGTEP